MARPVSRWSGPEVDGDLLLALAKKHRVVALLQRGIDEIGIKLSAAHRDRLRELALARAARSVFLSRHLLHLAEALHHAGIPVLPYKGPLLSVQAFGDPALREYDDLDVLVRKEDLMAARRALLARDFECLWKLDDCEAQWISRHGGEQSFVSRRGDCHVDVTSELVEPFFARLPVADAISRAEEVELEGARLRTFCVQDMLLFLCVHGAKHGWSRLAWVADVAALLNRHKGTKKEDVLADAQDARVWRMARLGLDLADGLNQVDTQAGSGGAVGRLAARAWARMPEGPAPSQGTPVMSFRLAVQDNLVQRARLVCRLLATPTLADRRACHLPDSLDWLYAAIRPARLLTRMGKRKLMRDSG